MSAIDPFASAASLAEAIRARRIGCLELLDLYLKRAEAHNPELNAIVVWQVEKARERARAADAALAKGEIWGPLHGLPMTVKDSYNVVGLPTTFGNPALKDNIATENADVVERLLKAGAIIYGKTNIPYLLADIQAYNDLYGTTNNPWDLTRTPGGSSGGGAAALAAGLVALEAGSDIAGSLRYPPHHCGIYGHRPSFGVVSWRGHALPGILNPTDISAVGPMARDAGDLALAMNVLAGPDALNLPAWRVELPPPRATKLRDFRVAVWSQSPLAPVSRSMADKLEAAVAAVGRKGAKVDGKARPAFDSEAGHRTYLTLLRSATAARLPEETFEAQMKIAGTIAPGDFSHKAAVARGVALRHREWLEADEARMRMRLAWAEFFKDFDVLVAPISPVPAIEHEHNPDWDARRIMVDGTPQPYMDQFFWAGLPACCHLPATSAPSGFVDGLPVGLQVIGPEGGDLTTIEFARLLAQEIGGFVPPPRYSA